MDREELYHSAEAYYVRMAASISRAHGHAEWSEDMAQEARMALWRFSADYDPLVNDNFRLAARMRVHGAVIDAMRAYDDGLVRTTADGERAYRSAALVPLDEARSVAVDPPGVKILEPLLEPLLEQLPAHWSAMLRPREELVLRLYYHEALPLREVAARINRCEARVWQLRARGLRRIRASVFGKRARLIAMAQLHD